MKIFHLCDHCATEYEVLLFHNVSDFHKCTCCGKANNPWIRVERSQPLSKEDLIENAKEKMLLINVKTTFLSTKESTLECVHGNNPDHCSKCDKLLRDIRL